MAVIARPAGGGIFLGMAGRIGPFHMRVARNGGRWRLDFERHARGILGQGDEAAAPGALGADAGRILVAVGAGDALIVVRAAPGVVGGPGAGGGDLEQATLATARCGAKDEEMVRLYRRAVLARGGQRQAVGAGGPAGG